MTRQEDISEKIMYMRGFEGCIGVCQMYKGCESIFQVEEMKSSKEKEAVNTFT